MNRDKAIDRIRKLLAHSNNREGAPRNEAEVENYLRFAKKLMDEFDISENEALGRKDESAMKSAYDRVKTVDGYSRASRLDDFMTIIAGAVAIICTVRIFTYKSNFPKRQFLRWVGLPEDIEVAEQLYASLLTEGRLLCKMRYGDARPKEYKGYMLGFGLNISNRANDMKNQPVLIDTTAIALAKDQIIDKWIANNMNITQRKARAERARSAQFVDGQLDGWADGDKVDLGNSNVNETARLK